MGWGGNNAEDYDGGLDYLRRSYIHSRNDFTELTILEDAEESS